MFKVIFYKAKLKKKDKLLNKLKGPALEVKR